MTAYTTQAGFLAVVTAPGVDTFAGLDLTRSTPSPITRSAGTYSYTAAASMSDFFGAGTIANPSLSTNTATDSITFSGLNASAIGGNFFGSDIDGAFVPGGAITLTATDSLGATVAQTISQATTQSFLGFVSTGQVVSLVVRSVAPTTGFLWPTVDNLTIASALPIPEPATYVLMLAGLGAVAGLARRRHG